MRRVWAAVLAAASGALIAIAAPAPATTAGLSVNSTGSSVMTLHLAQPLTITDAGLPVTFGAVPSWGAVVLARQARGSAVPQLPYYAGVGAVSDGRRAALVPFGGATTLPAGTYALYVLSPVGYRLSVKLALPGVPRSALAVWSRREVKVAATLDRQLASVAGLSDRVPVTMRPGGALVVLGAAIGAPVGHDLAACVVEGALPAGAEAKCGTKAMTSYREAMDVGYGDGRIALAIPAVPSGSFTTVIRAEGTGLGPGLAFGTLQWAWTAPRRTAVA
jgi:hypothetical protein